MADFMMEEFVDEEDFGFSRKARQRNNKSRQGHSLYACIEYLAQSTTSQEAKATEIFEIIETVTRTRGENYFINEANNERNGETPTHTAIKLFQFRSDTEKRVFLALAKGFPKSLFQSRMKTDYHGQTPLHMAVAKGNVWVVGTILEFMTQPVVPKSGKAHLLRSCATGSIFTNTVMMAEIPLSIAALTFNKETVDILLQHGAQLDGVNSQGDTLCHSLIRYSFLYPERRDDVLDMCQYISDDTVPYDTSVRASRLRKLRAKVWVMENGSGQNPLQLAALLGQHAIFTFIMNTQAYCFENFNDGLFDVKIFDVTDLDGVSTLPKDELVGEANNAIRRRPIKQKQNSNTLTRPRQSIEEDTRRKRPTFRRSVLQMLLELDPVESFQFILFPPLRRIIDQKWNLYRMYFYIWWFLHFAFMDCFSWYAMERSKQDYPINNSTNVNLSPQFNNRIFKNLFMTVYALVSFGVAGCYIVQEIIRTIKGRMPLTLASFRNPYSNGTFRLMFVLFGLSLIADSCLSVFIQSYELYSLYFSLLFGWLLCLFFIRALRPLSFITVLIQNVLVGDIFRFFVLLAVELIAFTTCMYMAMQAAAPLDTTFEHYGEVLLRMFQLMFGLGDIGAILDARKPFVAVIIFVLFIIFTTILMVNSLIAIMACTCIELVKPVGGISAHDMHWRLQRLSLVLFMESVLPNNLILHVGEGKHVLRYSNVANQRKMTYRYLLEARSLHNGYKAEEDNDTRAHPVGWRLKTAVVEAIENKLHLKANRTIHPSSKDSPPPSPPPEIPMVSKKTQTMPLKAQVSPTAIPPPLSLPPPLSPPPQKTPPPSIPPPPSPTPLPPSPPPTSPPVSRSPIPPPPSLPPSPSPSPPPSPTPPPSPPTPRRPKVVSQKPQFKAPPPPTPRHLSPSPTLSSISLSTIPEPIVEPEPCLDIVQPRVPVDVTNKRPPVLEIYYITKSCGCPDFECIHE